MVLIMIMIWFLVPSICLDGFWWFTNQSLGSRFVKLAYSFYFGPWLLVFCSSKWIWVRSRRCGCLVTWFGFQWIAKPGNMTAAPSWPDPYIAWIRRHLIYYSHCYITWFPWTMAIVTSQYSSQRMPSCWQYLKPHTLECFDIGIDHDTVCAGVVGTAIRNSTSCADRRAAGTTSAVPDCSTNHDSADRISGQFLFYHDHNLQRVRETCVFDVLYRCSSPSAFA